MRNVEGAQRRDGQPLGNHGGDAGDPGAGVRDVRGAGASCGVAVLAAAGVCLAIDIAERVPRVLHWGADLGLIDESTAAALRLTSIPATLNNAPDTPRAFSVWASEYEGWSGTPAQSGHAAGTATTPRPQLVDAQWDVDPAGGGVIELRFVDEVCGTRQGVTYRMDRFGVVSAQMWVERDGAGRTRPAGTDTTGGGTGMGIAQEAEARVAAPYTLEGLRALMPVPERADELLDFTGKWCRERSPQRAPLLDGSHVRRARRGKPGHDSPYLMALGTRSFGFRHGEVWATHLAWSGDGELIAERLPEGAGVFASVLGAGEALRSGEIMLLNGERYDTPPVIFIWSDKGLDGIADRLHRRLRARSSHPESPRPMTLNTWEAVYFDHDMDRLTALVERAARIGVERIVLDDGWFRGRRQADAGLGDWYVDPAVWPSGLDPLVKLVRAHGMQFGLWFEPEMINLDSDLARAHPQWVLGPAPDRGPTFRDQYVLDIAQPEAFAYLLDRLDALIEEYAIDYLKWDHNRDLLEPVGRRGEADRPATHEQTTALYALLDELRARHPGLEIETCSGGGGRVDLGIVDRTDRLWASDCIDPVERTSIERWTRMLVPPELIGSHYGADRAHTTGRLTDPGFRLAIALTSHAGIERDLVEADPSELELLASWIALYKEYRGLFATGVCVNADLDDEAVMLSGVVSEDRRHALFTWTRLATSGAGQSGRVRFPGLDPALSYRVRTRTELGVARRHEVSDPAWLIACEANGQPEGQRDGDASREERELVHSSETKEITDERGEQPGPGISLPGMILSVAGIPLPTLNPQQAMLFDIHAE